MLKPGATDATTLVDADDASEPPEALPVGFMIGGRYQIKRLLGMGGNGAVYEGEHVAVGHRVAIKVVHQTLANRSDVMERIQREARICGTLRHPHVGQVYDFGTLEDGAPYMVMELQDGRSLADVLAETRLPIAAIIHIARQLVDGLGAAHRHDAVHRDVKPDNVMIVRDQSGEVVVKLVDFGISKRLSARADHRVTGEGVAIGSPAYMSPEQLRGDDVDERTDIYSTGVLLYEAITGRLPFDQEQTIELVAAIMRDPFPAPRELRRDCPPELERIVLKAMSRDPAARYQGASEIGRALAEAQSVLRSSAVSLVYLSRPSTRPEAERTPSQHQRRIDTATLDAVQAQVRSMVRRPRRMLGAIGAVVAIGVLGLLALQTRERSAESAPITTAEKRVARPATPEKRSSTAPPTPAPTAAQATALEEPTPPAPQEGAPAQAAPLLKPPPSAAPQAAPRASRAPARAPTRANGPAAQPTPDPAELQAQLKEATSAFAMGELERARQLYRQVVASAPSMAEAWRGLGLAASRLGNRDEAARAYERYLVLRPSAQDAPRIRLELDKVKR